MEVIGGSSSSAELISLYRKRAKQYDRSTLLLYLAGFRHGAYRQLAVQHLALCRGDTIVDIGCGTGLNFSLLQDSIGPHGKIIGVDLTDAMLDKAAERVEADLQSVTGSGRHLPAPRRRSGKTRPTTNRCLVWLSIQFIKEPALLLDSLDEELI